MPESLRVDPPLETADYLSGLRLRLQTLERLRNLRVVGGELRRQLEVLTRLGALALRAQDRGAQLQGRDRPGIAGERDVQVLERGVGAPDLLEPLRTEHVAVAGIRAR